MYIIGLWIFCLAVPSESELEILILEGMKFKNGTPQGSVISPLLFSIMINYIYTQVGSDIGKYIFADDGAIWKRGRNVNDIVGKIQEAITEIESWSLTRGFRLSVEKTETLFFTRKRIGEEVRLKLYGTKESEDI